MWLKQRNAPKHRQLTMLQIKLHLQKATMLALLCVVNAAMQKAGQYQLLAVLMELHNGAKLVERCADMLASRGMGAVNPSKMPKGVKKARRDDTDFTQYAEGGTVNAAGNYTKPSLRKNIVSQVKAAATQGTGAGKWSARKAQLVAKKYKAAGGGYRD
jgi:hypothetical protein